MQHGRSGPAVATAATEGEIVTARQLSRLSGVSLSMLGKLSKSNMIPKPLGYEGRDALYDLADPALADWLARLQAAGYHRR